MDKSLTPSTAMPSFQRVGKILLPIALVYLVMLFGQPAGFEPGRLIREILGNPTILVQQLISGLANAAIVTIIAIGYTMVYGIVEMVNFAHSSVFMLGTMVALLFMVGLSGGVRTPLWLAILAFIPAMLFCGGLNAVIERFARANDDYSKILSQSLADRLAEAFAERMHERVRKEFWGYAADETLPISRETSRGMSQRPTRLANESGMPAD